MILPKTGIDKKGNDKSMVEQVEQETISING